MYWTPFLRRLRRMALKLWACVHFRMYTMLRFPRIGVAAHDPVFELKCWVFSIAYLLDLLRSRWTHGSFVTGFIHFAYFVPQFGT